MVTAQLMREPANPADPNAVQVLVGGRPVGYLPREDAPYAHGIIDALTAEGRPTTCRAELIGGTPDKPTIGITLHTDEGWRRLGPGAAFLDCSRPQHVTTVGEQEFQPIIEQVLASSGPEVLAHLGAGPTGGATLAVYVGGRQVGWLTPKMSERYTPVLWAVHQAGFECSTRTSIERDAKGVLQVTARMLKV